MSPAIATVDGSDHRLSPYNCVYLRELHDDQQIRQRLIYVWQNAEMRTVQRQYSANCQIAESSAEMMCFYTSTTGRVYTSANSKGQRMCGMRKK